MATIARAFARAFPGTQIEIETLKTIAMFCGVGLFVSLLLATYGLDLSPGFFWQRGCIALSRPPGIAKPWISKFDVRIGHRLFKPRPNSRERRAPAPNCRPHHAALVLACTVRLWAVTDCVQTSSRIVRQIQTVGRAILFAISLRITEPGLQTACAKPQAGEWSRSISGRSHNGQSQSCDCRLLRCRRLHFVRGVSFTFKDVDRSEHPRRHAVGRQIKLCDNSGPIEIGPKLKKKSIS
jgi:hypothetical protein